MNNDFLLIAHHFTNFIYFKEICFRLNYKLPKIKMYYIYIFILFNKGWDL